VVLAVLLSFVPLSGVPQQKDSNEKPASEQSADKPAKPASPAEKKADEKKEPPPVVTHHEIHVGGRVLKYTATTGTLPIRNGETDEIEANIFFIAYTLDNPGPKRPLMFSFNGGPGSSSVWLHLGAIGPRRVKMLPDGSMPPPPFELIDNEQTWLDQTDLVFIDPVGTGYSRATKKELAKKFYGLKGDIDSVGEFIRLYLSRYERWNSPLFLVGESYGTTRAAGLSGHLIDQGIAFSGVVLVSSILNFQTVGTSTGNDLPYVLFLPSYTSSAWYHKKLTPELQQRDLPSVLREAEQFASGPYSAALAKGDALTGQERQTILDQLSRLTGLDREVIDVNNLRVDQGVFSNQLLRREKLIAGRLDSRFTGPLPHGEIPSYYDPTIAIIRPPFTATLNNYMRSDLGYKSDLEYFILGGGIGEWDWGSAGGGFPDTSESLRQAFVKNPYMRLFVASGYYDLATPYFATQFTLSHMELDPQQHAKISLGYYEAGHMMYLRTDSLDRLKQDVSGFLAGALR
jgi:carboxypeptidase C (cathepsin A)